MKIIKAAKLEGNDLQKYMDNIRKEVELELQPDVNGINWGMEDDTIFLVVDFKDGTSETFDYEAWRFTGEPAYFDYDVDIIMNPVRKYMEENLINGHEVDRYEYIKSKSVMDSDGFYTDYTMYYDHEDSQYVFIFGDNDIYTPENSDPDWECDTQSQANEWFDNYHGFDEDDYGWRDDIESCDDIMSDWNIEDQVDAPDAIGKLNPGDKFVNRNGVVVEIIEPDRLGHIQFKIGDEVKSGNEKSIQQMLYRNNYMRKIETSQEFVDMGTGLEYWYFTTHGVQPGSVPKGLNIIKVVDTPEGSYFLTDRVITTKALKEYDIKERESKDVKASSVPGGRYWEPGWENAETNDSMYIHIVSNSWEDFLNQVEQQTGLKVDSAYKRRHESDNYIELVDEDLPSFSDNRFSAEYNVYSDGTFEFRGESLKPISNVESSCNIESSNAETNDFKIKDSDWYRLITRVERKTGMKVIDGTFDDERKFLTLQAPDGTIYHGEISQTIYYEFDSHWLTE